MRQLLQCGAVKRGRAISRQLGRVGLGAKQRSCPCLFGLRQRTRVAHLCRLLVAAHCAALRSACCVNASRQRIRQRVKISISTLLTSVRSPPVPLFFTMSLFDVEIISGRPTVVYRETRVPWKETDGSWRARAHTAPLPTHLSPPLVPSLEHAPSAARHPLPVPPRPVIPMFQPNFAPARFQLRRRRLRPLPLPPPLPRAARRRASPPRRVTA